MTRYNPEIDEQNPDFDEEPQAPSKTQVKKQMHYLQDLGGELCQLNNSQLRQLNLPENLREAIQEMQQINKFNAQKRQLQYIGKLMRQIDPEPVAAQLDVWKGRSVAHTAQLHHLERWREQLLQDDQALTRLLEQYPEMDIQRLRQLIRNARKEHELQKPPKSYREIFQLLKQGIGEG